MMASKQKRRPVRAFAVASALALTLCAPVAAFAADPTAGTNADATATATPASTITGTIHATTLKATVPTVVAFDIDPGATQTAALTGTFGASNKKIGQFTNPTNYTITNYSAVDVYGYVSSVTTTNATLINTKGDLAKAVGAPTTANTKVMVGLCGTADSYLDITKTDGWLMADIADTAAKRYYAFNKTTQGKLAASANAPTAAGGSATMTIRGAVLNGNWAENQSFQVKPVFKITASVPA